MRVHVSKKIRHNQRGKKLNIGLIIASLKRRLLVSGASTQTKFGLFGMALFMVFVAPMVLIAQSDSRPQPYRSTVAMIPSQATAVGFDNVASVGVQDLGGYALFQDFNTTNSVYLEGQTDTTPQFSSPTDEINNVSSEPVVPVIDALTDSPSTTPNTDTLPEPALETAVEEVIQPAVVDAEIAAEPEVVPEPEPVASVVQEEPSSEPEVVEPPVEVETPDPVAEPVSFNFFPLAAGRFALAQAVLTDALEAARTTTTEFEIFIEPEVEDFTTADVVDEVIQEPASATDAAQTEQPDSPASNVQPSVEEAPVVTDPASDVDSGLPNQENSRAESGLMPSMTFSNFGTPVLESGQTIDNLQLRLSLAGQYDVSFGNASLDVSYTFGDFTQSAGSVLLEEEFSNALNGGYYLIPLPSVSDPALIGEMTVTVSLDGQVAGVESLFIDAVWLEIDTLKFDKNVLKQRTKPDNLQALNKPQTLRFLSDELDFTRTQSPYFNLRYESQRNILARAARSLFGRQFAVIDSVEFLHAGVQPIGVNPTVQISDQGLINISLSDEDQARLKPGTYDVRITVSEGSVTTVDTFQFQWGLLAINTNKTSYSVNETVSVSMGSLTPNGNTVCNADLVLYVTDPSGFVEIVPVTESGQCDGNNVIDVPDYSSQFQAVLPGTYELYLERLDEAGGLLSHTAMTMEVVVDQLLSLERVGPTRIFPPATYPMELTVASQFAFEGTVTERVPASFEVYETDAEITVDGDWQILTWDISVSAGGATSVDYLFDAPDISPFLFNLGPATIDQVGEAVVNVETTVGSSTATSSETSTQSVVSNISFTENRQWQIASDAAGKMILFFDGDPSLLPDWDCLSCISGQPYFERFVMGSSTASTTGGSPTHTHTIASASVLGAAGSAIEDGGTGGAAIVSHLHTLTPTITTASNLPAYGQLRVIEYNTAGNPPTIPAGAIAIFDVASSSLPTDWFRYGALDGRFPRGQDSIGATGGSNTHTHTISGTLTAASGGTTRNRGGGVQAVGAGGAHTHTLSTATGVVNNEPPYIEVLFARASVDVSLTNGIITMWSGDVAGGWLDVSSDPAAPFSNRMPKGATSYGATGGAVSHSHADIFGAVTSAPDTTIGGRTGTAGSDGSHTHNVNLTGFSTNNNLPPYITAVFGKRQGTDPVYEQTSSRWYVNENAQTPTDPWPVGATDLGEQEPISATSTPLRVDDVVRLRMNVALSNATSTAGATFKLQYASADVCSGATGWLDVGGSASTSVWRGFNNAGVTDQGTLSTRLLASSSVSATYEENAVTAATPNDIGLDEYGEWDFVLEQNGAAAGTNYCFRMVESDGSPFLSYSHYPRLFTNEAPVAPSLQLPFDNEKVPTTTPAFTFLSTDPEDPRVHYEIQIDDTFDFSSPVIEDDTTSDPDRLFVNLDLGTDKAPYLDGNLIQFKPDTLLTNGNTYYWRVRAFDTEGSEQFGDWSVIRSFTVDTALLASAWFQTEDEQFDSNALSGVETGSDQVSLISGSTTGSIVSSPIRFTDGREGTTWQNLVVADTETVGDILYSIEYLDSDLNWGLIPDGDLPGNSAGFDLATTSLLALDVELYNTIRILADFTNVGGSPSLQDWTVNWGFRVPKPTITSLFSSEQTGTTTPTFQFSTTDPQSDDLTYQIEWSETIDFAAPITRTSDTDAGFVNIDTGSSTDPFIAGDEIQFTIQPVDALIGTTTYWWRVRAKDTTGADAYSFWTDPQSFTVIPGTEVSTWFQTTQEQFSSNVLSGTLALASDSVTVATTATEALIVYGEGTQNTPRYRQWNGSTISAEGSLLDIEAPLRWTQVQAATTREEYVAVTVGTDSDVNAQVFALGVWADQIELTTTMGNVNARGFDVVYETLSGDALVVYCDGDADPGFRVWNGSSWSAAGTVNLASASACEWIQLAADPVSDEVILLSRDAAGGSYEAQVWNGTAWGNSTTQGSVVDASNEGMAVMYEESGNQAIIVTSDGNPARFRWDSWNGTAWAGAGTQTVGDDFEWGQLARDIGSDQMVLCYIDEDQDAGVVRWTGAAWAGQTELDLDGKSKVDPGFACVFEDTAGRNAYIMTGISNTTQTNYYVWNTAAWSAATQVNAITDTATQQLLRTGDATILGLFFDDTNDALRFTTWDGSVWSGTQTLETDMSVGASPFGRPYSMAARNSGKDGTTIVTPGIGFADGLGPYWDSFSWNDDQTDGEILYYMQYLNPSDEWVFIPDVDLPGNGSGTTTGPYDLSALNVNTYNTLRPYADFTCDGSGNCPLLNDWTVTWAGGITVSGTIAEFDQSTAVTTGSVAVAVNGVLQSGKTGTIAAGAWSIDNVTVFPGDIITVFVTGAAEIDEAVGVTRYDGVGDVDGMVLYEQHLTLGSNDATTTPLTNADIGLYDFSNSEDVFISLTGTTLDICGGGGCLGAELHVLPGTYFVPTGRLLIHDFENNGYFTAGSYIHELTGSWDNNATTTMTGSTLVFSATSTTETVDNTSAPTDSFNNVTFGTTTGSGVWNLTSVLDVNGVLEVARGTLARGTTAIEVAGNLATRATGFWTGTGTTTFDGAAGSTWLDENATLQSIGQAVIDGANKVVTLAGDVAADSITIGSNDTLDASISNYSITVTGNWENQNNFLARSGTVFFAATDSGNTISTVGDAFYNLNFTGIGGDWSFTESTLLVNNNLTVATGTVTMPTATTTIAGSFDSTGGTFAHNNGALRFTSNGTESVTFDGSQFTNSAYTLVFDGGGVWNFTDTFATSSNDVLLNFGTVVFPSDTLAIGGSLITTLGTIDANNGTLRFYGSTSEVLTVSDESLNSVEFAGTGDWTFTGSTADLDGDLLVEQGTVTLPAITLTIGGSYSNADTIIAGAGEVVFDSLDIGETINFGGSTLTDVSFNSPTGGWTVTNPATTTGALSIDAANDWTLSGGQILSVGGDFTNTAGASTTWGGSTLALRAGDFEVNTKSDTGAVYGTLVVDAGVSVAWWNSSAAVYNVDATGSLYSQDHAENDGALYIYGAYTNTGGNEYWSYATDFDGTDLTGGAERPATVSFADSATASLVNSSLQIIGTPSASTTVTNQGTGTYTISVNSGTTTAQYYDFANLGLTGLTLENAVTVPLLRDGRYAVAADTGSALTISSTTIDQNPGKQIFGVTFATTTAISANNVSQTDGAPASFWWFRNGSGNLYGEDFDNDTGNPGSVRFDDSSLVVTLSGVVYSDAGVTPIIGGTCDGSTQVVTAVVSNGATYTGSCSAVDGSYSIAGVIILGDPTVTVYLDNASGGERANTITRTPTSDVTGLDLYQNRLIVRNEDAEALTIDNLAEFDNSNDSDMLFTAASSSVPKFLTVESGSELFVFATSTFAPGGDVTLNANAAANGYDGTLFIADNAAFVGSGTSTYTIGGRMELGAGSSFAAASSTVLFTATTTGKSVTAPSEITFNDISFIGAGGGWNVGADMVVLGDLVIDAGTVAGTGDITIPFGSMTGDGVLSLGAGTTTIASTNTLGGNGDWSFYNLQLGDTFAVGTTTPVFTSTTTVSGRLTIAAAHYLDAGNLQLNLSGIGNVFVEDGTFLEDTSTVRYSGAGSNVLATQYYNLDINSFAGAQTYTATGLGIIVDNDLTIGGQAASTFDLNSVDPVFDVNGDVVIRSNGTLEASDSSMFTIAGSYTNDGVLTANSGTITFDGTAVSDIAAGTSDFANILISSTGDVTFTQSATTTNQLTLQSAGSFTVDSGQTLAVGGNYFSEVTDGVTTWTGSTLRLYGSNDFNLNASTTSETYGTLAVADTAQVKMWNSSAAATDVAGTASLYSQDHSGTDGDLYIWGTYTGMGSVDFWSYATDFDGTDLTGGAERQVDVYMDSGSGVSLTTGELTVIGSPSASTTVQNQGVGSYSLVIGGSASTTLSYYVVRDIDADGLVFTGSPTVGSLSFGDIEVSQNGGTAITVGGSVISNNPAKTFTLNRFALNGVASGFNVTATGTSVSSWRFTNHYGDIAGEANDVDPDGDPGYVVWDDSAANITISGTVYSDEGSTVAGVGVCDGATNSVRIVVAGLTTFNTSCASGTGVFSVTNISYSPGDSIVAYLTAASGEAGATVTADPVSNINNFDIYIDRTIVRHEGVNPLTISDMAVYDSSDDANIPFTATVGSPDTVTLPSDTGLVVWSSKTFAPEGNVTVTGNGAGAAFDGTLTLQTGATFEAGSLAEHTIGGSLLAAAGASYEADTATTTFTSNTSGRTVDTNDAGLYNVAFTGTGAWTFTDSPTTVGNDLIIAGGTVTLTSGTTTIGGSFENTGGAFVASGGVLDFTSTVTGNTVTFGGSAAADVLFSGIAGAWNFGDTNATATESFVVAEGTVTLPSGELEVGQDFLVDATIAHAGGTVTVTGISGGNSITLNGNDLTSLTVVAPGGDYQLTDVSATLLGSLTLTSGTLSVGTGTLAIGGSFDVSGGVYQHSTGTLLFNSSTLGQFIDVGANDLYNVVIAGTGGWTMVDSATTTNNLSLLNAGSFEVPSGSVLRVEGVFSNDLDGANTTWSGSTLVLDGANAYSVNTSAENGDQYDTLVIGENSDIRIWNSAATTTSVAVSSSLYSQDHASVDGALNIYGDFHIGTTTEYWSYATDFDGTALSGSERAVTVSIAANATTSVDGGVLQIIGVLGNETTITNQGSGTYALAVSDGTFTAQYYALRNLSAAGLSLTGAPSILSLAFGDYELAVDGGSLLSVSSTTVNANASLVIPGSRFATTTAITGTNVSLTGVTSNAWTYTGHAGNLDGEDYDVDGATACGSIRWDDSACLITQQTDFRWRNDDGGLGVPNTEWYDLDWSARKQIRVANTNASDVTNAAVQMLVAYDADMQSDFEDIRITADDGLTLLDYWRGSTTAATLAELWVEIPLLESEDVTTLYMYYDNPSATNVSSSSATFVAADDFEDGSISEYSGQTGLFTVDGSFAFDGSNGLDNTGQEASQANLGGIFRFDQTVSQGETIRYQQYIDTSAGSGDEVCTLFAVQSPGTTNQNYAACVEQFGTDRIALVKDAVDNDASGTTLDSTSVTYVTGWYTIEIDWAVGGDIDLRLIGPTGTTVATLSATDTSYSSGGYGFTYWFHNGGWDSFISRPTLTFEPSIQFGLEQVSGGASWKAVQNTAATYDVGQVARLRIGVENSGLPISNQGFRLEYAPLGVSPSCEAVSAASYTPVPNQATCGLSPVCMQTTANYANGDDTVDLLTKMTGAYSLGEAVESPFNVTGLLGLGQNQYTELEYALTPTTNITDENLCFRVTDAGVDYGTYLEVAQLSLRFDPVVTNATLNNGEAISLLPGTTTLVYATGTVTDLNGFADITNATATIYRSGVAGGAVCSVDNNNCYRSEPGQCQFINCSGNSCTVQCEANVQYYAEPTDVSSLFEGEEWLAFIEAEDTAAGYGFASALGVELATLRAISVTGAINYGSLTANSDTGSFNASTSVLNLGNVEADLEVTGSDLTDGGASVIPVNEQKFATTTFTYSACGAICRLLSSTTPVALDVELAKPVVVSPAVQDDIYWGIFIPFGINSAPHQGVNLFTPVSP